MIHSIHWNRKDGVVSFIMLTLGAIIAAFAVEEFLVPNTIFDGGVTGISMIVSNVVPVRLSILVIVINIPFLIYGLKHFGKRFIVKTTYAMVLFSIALLFFEDLPHITEEKLLAVAFGGLFLGVGVGFVLRGGGCLDGTEIVAIMINKKTQFSVGKTILIFNIIIYLIAGLQNGIDAGLFSILMYFVSSKVIDLVELGFDQAKSIMIITEDGEAIANAIYQNFGRTVTFIRGEGLVSGSSKDILYCVVTRAEIYDIRKLINSLDVNAFTTISDVTEIIGNHMKQVAAEAQDEILLKKR